MLRSEYADVDEEARRRELQKSRLKALYATRRQTGARFEMARWGPAFRSVKGLAGVLKKVGAKVFANLKPYLQSLYARAIV